MALRTTVKKDKMLNLTRFTETGGNMSGEERRTAPRATVNLTVTEEFLAKEQTVTAIDISVYGMHYLRPDDSSRRTNQEVLLTFTMDEGFEPIKALAWVVKESKVENQIASHVTFMFLPEKDEHTIRDFVATRKVQSQDTAAAT